MKDILESILDFVGEGIIAIDGDGRIKCYNKKAKEIFGIIYNQGMGHEAGIIENNDIVIIADTGLGEDDGGLSRQDLTSIGVDTRSLKKGDSFTVIGIMGSEIGTAALEFSGEHTGSIKIRKTLNGIDISASVSFETRSANIRVSHIDFPFKFIKSVGHMVVLCGKTGKVKFYQAKGYTIRREDIKNLLKGGSFSAKGENYNIIDVVGKNIFDVHPRESNIDIVEFVESAKGEPNSYNDQVKVINGRPTRCSLIQLKTNGKIKGALLKVQDITELDSIIKERDYAIASLNEVGNKLKDTDAFGRIIGQSDSIRGVKSLARKAAETDSTILILGESGTGKGLLAECIHNQSRRKSKPFIHINCTSIPDELLESELFGYEGGAFTGARKEGKKGLFEAAEGGTIFLDEIGDIPPYMQVKLLHVLQSKQFMRVGGTKPINVDVKIITATNRELEKAVDEGHFRSDLYYRINVFPIYIPPLRMRNEDIYPLIVHLLPFICERIGVKEKRASVDAIRAMLEYDWPGNVRQLENTLERAVNISDGDTIFKEHLNLRESKTVKHVHCEIKPVTSVPKSLAIVLEEAEKAALEASLLASEGNRTEAMKILGIGKTSFYEKLKKYDLK